MNRKEYLKKKFEYYQHMKELSEEQHKYLTERLKLEITLLESSVRSKLVNEVTEHILSKRIKHDITSEVKEKALEWLKEDIDKYFNTLNNNQIHFTLNIQRNNEIIDKLVNTINRMIKQAPDIFSPELIIQTDLSGKGSIDCNKCKLYGECDHLGAYYKDNKWCYEGGEKE